ncbi:MAG: class I SAM-dependent methyltransferase [Methanocella sp.]
MLLNELLKVDGDVFLIEGSFEGLELNLKSLDYMDKLRSLPEGAVPAALKISDRKGDMPGVAFQNRHPDGDFWFLVPYPHAPPARRQTELMATSLLGSGVVASSKSRKVDGPRLREALREYLSVSLVERALCDCTKDVEPLSFAVNGDRDRRIGTLVRAQAKKHGMDIGSIDALEICCGNGMSTRPLNGIFRSVLSVDNDKCAVCNGLYHGTLQPESAMVIDAMRLTQYGLGQFGSVVGFMLGTIYEFNKPVWRKIFEEALRMTNDGGLLLFTVNQKEEMDFMQECFASMGIDGEVIDNRQKDSIYDSWAFVAVKNADR